MSTKMQALVDAANVARSELSADTSQGAPLQGTTSVNDVLTGILSAVSAGTATGGSLKTYGIDVDKNGVFSFDAAAFATAYGADPTGTQTAIAGSFAANLNKAADSAIAPVFGSVTQAMSSITNTEGTLNDQISTWTTRLADIQTRMQQKYTAMETALAKLQSTGTYLTSMLKSVNGSGSTSSSN